MTRLFVAAVCVAGMTLFGPARLIAAEPGRPILDKAADAASVAVGPTEWGKVVDLCREADRAGLSDADKKLDDKLLGDALVRRAEFAVEAAREAAVVNRGVKDNEPLDNARTAALADLEEAAALDPGRWRAHWLIAQLHMLAGGEPERAKEALEDSLKAAGDDKKLQSRSLAMRAAIRETNEEKLADYNKAIELDPKNPDAYRGRAVLKVLDGKIDDAVVDLKAARDADPRDLRTQEAYAQALLDLQRPDEAIESLGAAMKLMPEVPSLYLSRARVFARIEKYDEAIADVNKILEMRPKNPTALLAKAEIERRAGKLDESLADIQTAQEVEPNSLDAALMQAEVLTDLKKSDSALEGFRAFILAHAPDNAEIWTRLGMLALADKKYEIGVNAFNRSIELEPRNPLALRTRADCYISMGKHRDAMKDYEEVLKFAPRDSGTLNNLAWLLCTSPQDSIRDGKRALEFAKLAAEETDEKAPHILSTVAAAYAETGDFEKAIEYIDKGLKLVGDDPVKESLVNEKAHYEKKQPFREETPSAAEESSAEEADKKAADEKKPADEKPADEKASPKPAEGKTTKAADVPKDR